MRRPGSEPLNLLLIEDDPHAAALFVERTRHFARGEFSVTQARTLESGIEEAADVKFDLAVIDLTLPDSTGIETCSRFNTEQPALPFVVLSGVEDTSLAETLSQAGARAAIVKADCSGHDLVNTLRSAASGRSAHDSGHGEPGSSGAVARARFRNAIVDNADGIIVTALDGEIRLVSTGAERLLGRPASDLVGSPLGIELHPRVPVRTQVAMERAQEPGSAVGINVPGALAGLVEASRLKITELEIWPFTHQWSGERMIVCALRDVTSQSAEEARQRNIVRLEQRLQVTSGIEPVCSEIALRLGALAKFSRFEVALWRHELQRLEIMSETGSPARGRERSSLVTRESSPDGYLSWLSATSDGPGGGRVTVSIGLEEPGAYSDRETELLGRCAEMVSRAIAELRRSPALVPADGTGERASGVSGDFELPEAA